MIRTLERVHGRSRSPVGVREHFPSTNARDEQYRVA